MLVVLVAASISAVAATAKADAAAEARYHSGRGAQLYAAGHAADALEAFLLSQQVAPNPHTVFNAALCFDRLRRYDEAYAFFDDYLATISRLGETEIADDEQRRTSVAESALARIAPLVARVSVISEPAGATIFVDRDEVGAYGAAPRTLALAPGDHRIELRLDGYENLQLPVVARIGESVSLAGTLVRTVSPMEVDVTPSAHVIVVDSSGATVADAESPLRIVLPLGEYEVRAQREGYEPSHRTVRVERGEACRLIVPLEPLPSPTGDVTVTANERGAVVALDDRLVGFAPVVIPDVGVGPHRIRVHRSGLLDWTGSVDVADSRRSWLTVTLEPPSRTVHSRASYILGGLGLALAVGAVASFVVAGHRYDTYERSASVAGANDQFRQSLYLDARRMDTVATSMAGFGSLSFGLGVFLYFRTRDVVGEPSRGLVTSEEAR